jgi:TRAP transporter 4TM/12TM fusion protein
MKRTGFRPPFAAAVEAVASTGGQIMPPVMGAAAFVMAEFLVVPYAQVALWALVPALLYYVAVFVAVHLEAKRCHLAGVPRSELPRFLTVMAVRGHLFVPVFVVLFGLILGYSAPRCALAGALTCIPIALMRATTRVGINWHSVVGALVDGARNTLAVAMACACAGIVIGCVTITGLGITFTQMVIMLSQNSLAAALALTAIAGIVLGMGMPTTPSYIVMVSLLVPAVIKLGAIPPAAHMFAFYFAILSAITPPVALAVFAAAAIAQVPVISIALISMRLCLVAFILPFMWIYHPELMLQDMRLAMWPAMLGAFSALLVATVALAAMQVGHFKGRLQIIERVLLGIAAALIFWPGAVTTAIGCVVSALIMGRKLLRKKHRDTSVA